MKGRFGGLSSFHEYITGTVDGPPAALQDRQLLKT